MPVFPVVINNRGVSHANNCLREGYISSERVIFLQRGLYFFREGYVSSERVIFLQRGLYFFREGYISSERVIFLQRGLYFFREGYTSSERVIFLQRGLHFFREGYISSERVIFLQRGLYFFLKFRHCTDMYLKQQQKKPLTVTDNKKKIPATVWNDLRVWLLQNVLIEGLAVYTLRCAYVLSLPQCFKELISIIYNCLCIHSAVLTCLPYLIQCFKELISII